MSSAETGLATLILTDFIQPMVKKYRKKPLSDSAATTFSQNIRYVVLIYLFKAKVMDEGQGRGSLHDYTTGKINVYDKIT